MLYPVCLKWNSLVDDVIAHKYLSMPDPGEGLGEPIPPPPPYFYANWGPKGRKKIFWRPPPRFIRVWMTPPPPQFLNDKISASCKTNISRKNYLKRCKQQILILEKPVRLTSFQTPHNYFHFNLLHVCPSVWSLPSLLFTLLFILPFTIVSGSFWCFTQFRGSSQCLIFDWFVGHSFSLKDSVRYYFKDVLTSLASS